jgi:hypothetical protein
MSDRNLASCFCKKIATGSHRAEELPQTLFKTVRDDAPISGDWEHISRCEICGQYWHKYTVCGHANVEMFRKITAREREDLLHASKSAEVAQR